MGLLDRMKKKFEEPSSPKKVKNVVEDKKKKKNSKKKETGLDIEEIKRAQALESGVAPKGEKKKDTKKKTDNSPKDTKTAFKILIQPLITEKASSMGSEGKYVFEVHKRATKAEVRKAVSAIYGVNPVSVNIINIKGKDIRFGLQRGRTKDQKKAIVTLPKGKTIDVYQT